jgi:ATP/maltotriose-dependent transcriptional regulator MalT
MLNAQSSLYWARALCAAGNLAQYQSDFGQAVTLCGESLALFRALDDPCGIADALWGLGRVAYSGGNYPAARAMYEESIALARQIGDQWRSASALIHLGSLLGWQGDLALARQHLEAGLRIARSVGDKRSIAYALQTLAGLARHQGDAIAVRRLAEEGLALARELHDKRAIARAQHMLALIAIEQGDAALACALLDEAHVLVREIGDQLLLVWGLAHHALAAIAQGQVRWAAQLLGASDVLADAIGLLARPTETANPANPIGKHMLATIRATLGEAAFAAAWAEGRAMTPEQALAAHPAPNDEEPTPANDLQAVKQVAGAPSTARPSPGTVPDLAKLTARELEVLRLVATGLTDAQVAEQLVVSRRTVNFHLSSIYSKLGVNSRLAATRYALDHELI